MTESESQSLKSKVGTSPPAHLLWASDGHDKKQKQYVLNSCYVSEAKADLDLLQSIPK